MHLPFEHFRYFPHGINGMLAGSATVFFAYIGFDTVASTAEEVKMILTNHVVHFLYGDADFSLFQPL
jgi:amino acid transporter